MTHSDAECNIRQQQQANNGSANVTSIQYPCQHANIVSIQHPRQQAPVANVQQPCQHSNAPNSQQQHQHGNSANVSHPFLFGHNIRRQPQPASSTTAGGFQGGLSYMETTAAADDTALAISSDETVDEAVQAKPPVMLGRDRPLDGPFAGTVGLLGEPIDFAASMAVTEP